jgi:hypothetical protein
MQSCGERVQQSRGKLVVRLGGAEEVFDEGG